MNAAQCLTGLFVWAVGVGLILLFNYSAHRNDPPDWKG
jgi:hypothetical protein